MSNEKMRDVAPLNPSYGLGDGWLRTGRIEQAQLPAWLIHCAGLTYINMLSLPSDIIETGLIAQKCKGGVMRVVPPIGLAAIAVLSVAWPAACQEGTSADDLKKGRELAIQVCSYCHVAAPDQPYKPILQPPAPSFASIAQRKNISAESVQTFLTTTHRGLDKPKGMPNAELLDYQTRQVTIYLLSLRKKP